MKQIIKIICKDSPSGKIKAGDVRGVYLYPKNTFGSVSLRNFLYIQVDTNEDLRRTLRKKTTDLETGIDTFEWVGNVSQEYLGDWVKGVDFAALTNPDRAVQPFLRAVDCARDFDGKSSPLEVNDPKRLTELLLSDRLKTRKPNELLFENDFECACDDAGSNDELFLDLSLPYRLISIDGEHRFGERLVR
jgi:hypothetical protein